MKTFQIQYEKALHCKLETYCYAAIRVKGKYILFQISTKEAARIVRKAKLKINRQLSSWKKGDRNSIVFT